MNILKKLESAQDKQYLGFAKLEKGFYEIECFKIVKNKFGRKK